MRMRMRIGFGVCDAFVCMGTVALPTILLASCLALASSHPEIPSLRPSPPVAHQIQEDDGFVVALGIDGMRA